MNMKKILLPLLILTLITATATSQLELDPESFTPEKSSPVLNFLAGDQKIELEIDINNTETYKMGIETKGINITTTNEQGFENPTIEIKTDAETFKQITSSEKPLQELKNELGKGVELKAKGLFNKLRVGLIKLLIKTAG
mgnify:CR=1 FL=1